MSKVKIYFSGSIRAGRGDVEIYKKLINHLKIYGEVLTEHVGNIDLSSNGESNLNDEEIHERDMAWLGQSRYIVAEVTNPSLGVAYEIGRIVERNIIKADHIKQKILCLYRVQTDKKLSAMISGCRDLTINEYKTLNEAYESIDNFFKNGK